MPSILLFGYIVIWIGSFLLLIAGGRCGNKTKKDNKYLMLFSFNLLVSGVACVILASWPFVYTDLRLEYLGAGRAEEPAAWLDSVALENRAEAIELYHSGMGVGWPITAISWYILFGLPLSVVLTIFSKLVDHVREYRAKRS